MRFSAVFTVLVGSVIVNALPTARHYQEMATGGTVNYAPATPESHHDDPLNLPGSESLLGGNGGVLKAFSGNADGGDLRGFQKDGHSSSSKYPLKSTSGGGTVNGVPAEGGLVDVFNNNAGGGLLQGGKFLKGSQRS